MDIRLRWINKVFVFEPVTEKGRKFLMAQGETEGYKVAPDAVIVSTGKASSIIEGCVRRKLKVN